VIIPLRSGYADGARSILSPWIGRHRPKSVLKTCVFPVVRPDL